MTVICVMTKAPVAGQVKTRLCPPLAPEAAAALARAFLLDTVGVAMAVAGGRVMLAVAGDRDEMPASLAELESFDQRGSDLGARISSSIEAALERGDRALIIGSDLPGLPAAHLEQAARALDDADVCIGPSSDGGFYLIGARRWRIDLLDHLPWSDARTRVATIAQLEARGFSVALAPSFDDIDEPGDLERLRAILARDPTIAPATAAAL